ncbi:MAG: hypothetical protein JRJ56_04320, partial [Deltaproteobacteria bacterium]|nr:hypothetical protein [Deltaproteobacteria bacterium]
VVLLMEHEVPRHPLIRLLFYIRIYSMGSGDAREFIDGGTAFLEKLFPVVELRHSPSGKSKLFLCRRREPRP